MEEKFRLKGLRRGWIVETIKGGEYAFTDEDDLFGRFFKVRFDDFVEKALHTE